MSEPSERAFPIADALIECCMQGAGAPVLLLHGIPGDLRTLLPTAGRLADRCEAITVSLPALGQGMRASRPFGTAGQRDDVIDLIRSIGRGPVHLVAWSYSAQAAMAVAITRPDLVRSLFLYEPGFPTFVETASARDEVQADTIAAFGPVAEALGRGDAEAALRYAIDGAANELGYFEAQPEALRAIHWETAGMLAALFTQTPPLALGTADLRAIACPVTVARGALTRACYRIVSDEAARLIRDTTHVVVPGAGHLLPERSPDAFSLLIRAHLDRAAGGEPRVGTRPGTEN